MPNPRLSGSPGSWSSCLGGATQQDAYRHAIQGAGPYIEVPRRSSFEFISRQARDASTQYGVTSISVLAVKAGT
jgi:hypothetical protein